MKFFSEDNLTLAARARATMTAKINMFPSGVFYFAVHNVRFKNFTIIRPNRPKIFRFVRIFNSNESNTFIFEFEPIIYFIIPTRSVVLVKFNIVTL